MVGLSIPKSRRACTAVIGCIRAWYQATTPKVEGVQISIGPLWNVTPSVTLQRSDGHNEITP